VNERRIRCVLGMVGSDKHSKGIRTIARIFRDHGLEVIYVGEYNTPENVVGVAVSEDADFIGLSFSNGNYMARLGDVMAALDTAQARNIAVVAGGLIHSEDVEELQRMGVSAVFGPGSEPAGMLDWVDRTFAGDADDSRATTAPAAARGHTS
jgi:methylmalonyl-CoA mutase C-terminal domain/subunit